MRRRNLRSIVIGCVVLAAVAALVAYIFLKTETPAEREVGRDSSERAPTETSAPPAATPSSTRGGDSRLEEMAYAKPVAEGNWVSWEDTELLVAKDQLIIVAERGATIGQISSALEDLGGSIVGEIPSVGIYQVEFPSDLGLQEAMEFLEQAPEVEAAFPNPRAEISRTPPPSISPHGIWFDLPGSAYLREIRAPEAWTIHTGSEEVTIGIVDSGVDEIPDLRSKIVGRFDLGNPDSKIPDTSPGRPADFTLETAGHAYHGTVVAGVAAAAANDNDGMTGVSWGSTLAVVKMWKGGKSLFDLAAGIDAAIDLDAKVINVSGGSPVLQAWLDGMKAVVERAARREVLIVAAGANHGFPREIQYSLGAFPAWYAEDHQNVIAVGSTENGEGTFVGGYGASITVSAPREVLGYSPFLKFDPALVDGSRSWSGTSYAAPQVSGLAALIWSLDHDHNGEFTLTPADVREIITETAMTPPPGETRTGAGVIDAAAALRQASENLGIPIGGEEKSKGNWKSQVSVNAGGQFTCELLEGGSIRCWGNDSNGRSTPPTGRFLSISTGGHHSCGVLEGGSVRCWGLDDSGQATAPEGRFRSVSAGTEHSCGVLEGGFVRCWGLNDYGQAMAPEGRFRSVSAGTEHSCGVLEGGFVRCWGENRRGEAAPPEEGRFLSVSAGRWYSCGVLLDGLIRCWGSSYSGEATPPEDRFLSVSAGWRHTCGKLENGSIRCWGNDDHGQAAPPEGPFLSVNVGWDHSCGKLEDGSIRCWGNDEYGKATPPESRFVSVSIGSAHMCGVLEGGTVRCWGHDHLGQAAPPEGRFLSISVRSHHSCGVLEDGSVSCWGGNEFGQSSPPEGRFLSVSTWSNHTCGVLKDGSVRCWGDDFHGQATPPEGRFQAVSVGGYHSCGLLEGGSVRCWGRNGYGQATPPEGRFLSVSAGHRHSCGVLEDGSVRCWGGDYSGEAKPPEGHFHSVSTAANHSCGVLEGGSVRCWGYNDYGQSTPPEGRFLSVNAGHSQSCGVLEDGSVRCWGQFTAFIPAVPTLPLK